MEKVVNYKIYAGYYEIYVTNKNLEKPFMLQLETQDVTEVTEYLNNIDGHILVDIDVYDGCNCNAVFKIVNGKPEVIEDFFEED